MEMRNSGAIVLILKLQYGLFSKEEIQPGPIVMLLTICRAAPTICASGCCTLGVNILGWMETWIFLGFFGLTSRGETAKNRYAVVGNQKQVRFGYRGKAESTHTCIAASGTKAIQLLGPVLIVTRLTILVVLRCAAIRHGTPPRAIRDGRRHAAVMPFVRGVDSQEQGPTHRRRHKTHHTPL